eukprot:5732220-Pleurochrysis_carterae.AAC.1
MAAFEMLDGFPKAMGTSVQATEWCPTMDLLAVLFVDGALAVHRVTWAKLFALPARGENARVVTLGWHPDGQTLAAGHEDGSITLYNVEDGEQLALLQFNTAPLLTIHWICAPTDFALADSPYAAPLDGIFPPLPVLPKPAAAQQMLFDHSQTQAPSRPPKQSVLLRANPRTQTHEFARTHEHTHACPPARPPAR